MTPTPGAMRAAESIWTLIVLGDECPTVDDLARLIDDATALPDLVESADSVCNKHLHDGMFDGVEWRDVNTLRAALAKHRGEA